MTTDRLADLRAEYANTGMVKYDGAVWLISQVVVLGEQVQQLAAAVPVPPPADQTAPRDRLADALYALMLRNGWDGERTEPVVREMDLVLDAVLAVLPEQTDRGAVLREAADAIDRKDAEQGYPEDGVGWATAELRRMAAEDEPASCAECGHPSTVHQEGDDPVTPGECSACPDDDARHDYRAAVGEQPESQHLGGRANAEDCPACTGTNPPYPFLCPGPDTDATQPETQEARPSHHRWNTETLDNVANEWAPGMRFTSRAVALERYQAISAQYPPWKDGAPVRRRFVRETTSYTVETPE